jgi:hypothetical protein
VPDDAGIFFPSEFDIRSGWDTKSASFFLALSDEIVDGFAGSETYAVEAIGPNGILKDVHIDAAGLDLALYSFVGTVRTYLFLGFFDRGIE